MLESVPCQNCRRPFHIDHHDRDFYFHMKVPEPTFCPNCRLQRRLAFRNKRSLSARTCDLCGKDMISMYAPDSDFTVYCQDCFYSDRWDPLSYGRPYDFQKTFFEQFLHLDRVIPHLSLFQHTKDDADDCFDCEWIQNCESCYESVLCENCQRTWYSILCFDCRDTSFSFDCRDCSDVIGCSGLRHKQHYIFNKPATKTEYEEFLEKNPMSSQENISSLQVRAHELWKSVPQRGACIEQSSDVSGHIIRESKNCQHCVAVEKSENVRHGLLVKEVSNAMDVTSVRSGRLLYEVLGAADHVADIRFSIAILDGSTNIEYSRLLSDCHFCFGCINLRNKSYCILNRQYSKDAYHELVIRARQPRLSKDAFAPLPRVVAHMNDLPFLDRRKRVYKYGEFFPYELSPFGYNETIANEYFSLEKEVIIKDGFNYEDIGEAEDDPLAPSQLDFYRRFGLPIPRLTAFERHRRRLEFVSNHRTIYTRPCSNCNQDTPTAYLPTEFPHIYCEKCYAAKIS